MVLDPGARHARELLDSVLGIVVEAIDDGGGQGLYDLRFQFEDRAVAAEVKRLVRPGYQQIRRLTGARLYEQCDDLHWVYLVFVRERTQVEGLAADLPGLLQELERIAPGQPYETAKWGPGAPLWRAGVTSVSPIRPTANNPPGFHLYPDGNGGLVPGLQATVDFAVRWLNSGDGSAETLLKQLRGAEDADERHAFLLIGLEHLEAYSLLFPQDAHQLLSGSPVLPEPLDGMWLAPHETGSGVLLHWSRRMGWRRWHFHLGDEPSGPRPNV